MTPWRRYGWIGAALLVVLLGLLVWRQLQPPPMPTLPPGPNARTEDAPNH